MRVRLLGGFSILVGDHSIGEDGWRLRKAKSLAKLLAISRGHSLHRDRAAETLWPDLAPESAANNLSHALHAARRALSPGAPKAASRYLERRGDRISLCPDVPLRVDAEAFEEEAAIARRVREPAAYRAAIELYDGELLPDDPYEPWAEERRGALRSTHLDLLAELAALHEERGELDPAVESSRRLLEEEPTHEEAHARLMRLHALSGRRREALGQYERLRKALSEELGAEPSVSVRRLREEILDGRLPSPPARPEYLPPEKKAPGTGLHNLPAARTSFVGRERETAEVRRALAVTPLVTLTGAGGCGKTRLALEVVRELVWSYPEGAWLVELAPLSEPGLVPQAVATALGAREQPGRDLTDSLVDALRRKKALLLLDNCEHVVDAAASLVDALLGSCPRLRVLATSREPLGVAGEVSRRVPPLSVPGTERPSVVGELTRYEAVRLFVERARARLPDFELGSENARAVAEVCRRLDGLPLAIELATARVTALAVEQVAERLGDSLSLLAAGPRGAVPRQRAMRATIGWSYGLLEEAEKGLFGRLSVFAGGFTLEAAEEVGGGRGRGGVLDLLPRLVDKSLVVAEAGEGGALRYRMLQPIRQYAREKLEEGEEAEQARKRHAEHYLALARRAELSGPDQSLWLDRLETEHDNLRAALRWSLGGREAELGLRLASALWLFWYTRGYLSEGREWLEKGAHAGGASQLRLKARALCNAGELAVRQGELGVAKGTVEEALALFRELEDKGGIVSALTLLGIVRMLGQQDLETVPALHREAVSLMPEVEDPRAHAYVVMFSGIMAVSRGDWERAEALFEESLAQFREVRDVLGVGHCLTNLGLSAVARGDHARAADRFRENLRVMPGSDVASVLHNLVGLACTASARGLPARAARLWGAAEAIGEAYDLRITPMTLSRINHDEYLSTAQAQLGAAAFAAARAEGKAMTQEEATRFALGNAGPSPPRVADRPGSAEPVGSAEGLARTRAKALNGAGSLAIFQGEHEVARALLEEALALFRELKDKDGTATALADLGMALAHGGEEGRVAALREEAETLRREPLSPRVVAHLLAFLGMAALSARDYEQAMALPEEARILYRELEDAIGVVFSLTAQGMTALEAGEPDRAGTYFGENLQLLRKIEHKMSIAYCLLGLAGVAGERGQPARAARLWGAAEALREAIGMILSPFDRSHYDYEGRTAAARYLMDEEAWEAAWAEGRTMTQQEVIEYALETCEPDPPEPTTPARRSSRNLTRREEEVAALVAQELSNRQVAQELSISERTVETHVRNVLKKLGLKSRVQVAERRPGDDPG